MSVDMRRVIRAAVVAALDEAAPQTQPKPQPKRRLSGGRAMLVGAGLMTAGRLAFSSRGRDMLDTVKRGFGDLEARLAALSEDEASGDADADVDEKELGEDEDLDVEDYEEQDAELAQDERPNGSDPTARRSRGRK